MNLGNYREIQFVRSIQNIITHYKSTGYNVDYGLGVILYGGADLNFSLEACA